MSLETNAVSICVLTYGDHCALVRQCLESIFANESACSRQIVVGANSPSAETTEYLEALRARGDIDHLEVSEVNLNKCPMMRRLFAKVKHELMWWFDDDSRIVEPHTLDRWLEQVRKSGPTVKVWGEGLFCNEVFGFTHMNEAATHRLIRAASWYRGLPLPSWRPGGKGEFHFRGKNQGDGRWYFTAGGCWMARMSALREIDWPDPRLLVVGDDVFMGEAIRQQGWDMAHHGAIGVEVDTEKSRGERRCAVFDSEFMEACGR